MVKAIQIGLGAWGFSWSKDVIPNVPSVEMVGYVDTSPEAQQRVQTELGIDPKLCYSSLEDAAHRAGAVLAICTLRTEAHYPVVKRCLELGLHVLVEKPFTTTIAQGKELVALAKAQNKLLMVSQNYRHQPAPIAAAKLVASGKFGPLSMVSIDFRRHGPSQGYRYWDMPDPLLADMSIHHFDLMRYVLGDEAKRLSARTWNPPGSPFQFDPTGVVTIEFAKGTMVTYRASWMSSQPVTPGPANGSWTALRAPSPGPPASFPRQARPRKAGAASARRRGRTGRARRNPIPGPHRHAVHHRPCYRNRRNPGRLQLRRRQSRLAGPRAGIDPFGLPRRRLGRGRRGHRLTHRT
ncbi:Gfo/Idh/MocA family protein [Devosia aurantiaca]|uniref:Gfo/Idh/MocA family oxidoreductase n=1 Tax=Devosia aurantiaca TaxID=2714858 RepID=A0A6M1SLF1_9HYPH|nr:Gfo/Idh/MocA family oxidoreductase [Devosia aurantiaca]NGP17614.1 Gfo/Idh/MocA family oxidoreductase [Devosia aurantiaca]